MLPAGIGGPLSRVPSDSLHHWPVVEEQMSDTTSAMVTPNSFGFGDRMVAEAVLREKEHLEISSDN